MLYVCCMLNDTQLLLKLFTILLRYPYYSQFRILVLILPLRAKNNFANYITFLFFTDLKYAWVLWYVFSSVKKC